MLFVPKGMGLALLGLGYIVCWLCEFQDSLLPFSRWITVPHVARLEAKCERFTVKSFFVDVALSFKSKGKQY